MPLARRPLIPGEPAYERWLAVLIPMAWLTAAAAIFGRHLRFPPCLLFRFTHIPCPSCGSTRATTALAHGDIALALYFNPAWTLLCLGSIALWGYAIFVTLGRTHVLRFDVPTRAEGRFWRVAFIGAVAINWLWNIWRECA
jgi:hypothetical protein